MKEPFYKKIVKQSPAGYALHKIICNKEGIPYDYKFIEVNSAFENLTGLLAEDIIGKSATEILPDIRNEKFDWVKEYGKIALGGDSEEFEQYSIPLGRWYKVYAFSPKKNYFITNFIDVTQLFESEEKYRNITENISDVVWITDMSLKMTYVSPSVEKLLGEPADVHLKRTLEEKFPPESLKTISKILAEELENEKDPEINKDRSRMIELEHYRADGTLIWVAMHISFIRGNTGNAIGFQGVSRDISDRKRVESALEESKQKYFSYIENAPDGIFIVDEKGQLIEANTAGGLMTGYSGEELLGITFQDMIAGEYLESAAALFEKLKKTGSMHGELKYRRKDGVEKWAALDAVKISDSRFLSFAKDIAKRKQAEIEIREERDRAQMYLDIAGVMFVAYDKDNKVSLINRKGCEILRSGKEEILGKDWMEQFIPESCRKDVEKVFERIKMGEIEDDRVFENPVITSDGEERLISWRNTVLHDDAGNITGILSSGIDITDHNMALKALRESERSKAVLISHIPGLAYRCQYDKSWTMKFLSDGCTKLTGYQPEVLIDNKDLSYNDLICMEYREAVWSEWTRVLERKESFTYEYEIITAAGERKWVWEMGQGIYNNSGDIAALEGIVLDITESKRRFNQIQYMNDHDFMTGLYNRKYFEEEKERLDQEKCFPLSIIIADINGVRLINDAFGHAEGDRIIKETAGILRSRCREKDVMARTGGDEFSILLPDTDLEEASEILLSIQGACEEYNLNMKEKTNPINLSIGFGSKQIKEQSIDAVEKEAEEYLYKRKLLERKSHHSTIISSVMATLYARSQETEEHAVRIAEFSNKVGKQLQLSQQSLDELHLFAMLHDIGKVGIDDRVLNKPGKLSAAEWSVMKKHPEIGYRIAMSAPELEFIAEYILSHHERWDGMGYPRGLRGEEIPLLARILSVVDAYDAMTENRIYRKAFKKDRAIEEIIKNAGTQFDPKIAEIFIQIIQTNDRR